MKYGFVESYDIVTGRGTITPNNLGPELPFAIAPGFEIAVGQRVTYDLADRAVNIALDKSPLLSTDEDTRSTPTVNSFGVKV